VNGHNLHMTTRLILIKAPARGALGAVRLRVRTEAIAGQALTVRCGGKKNRGQSLVDTYFKLATVQIQRRLKSNILINEHACSELIKTEAYIFFFSFFFFENKY
jgi:hypothetical protein